MKRNLNWLSLIVILLLPLLAFAASDIYRPVDYEEVTVDNTSGGVALTAAKYLSGSKILADFAMITVTDAAINYSVTSTVPTSSVGVPVLPYGVFVLGTFDEIKAFRAIRTGGVSGKVRVQYYKWY